VHRCALREVEQPGQPFMDGRWDLLLSEAVVEMDGGPHCRELPGAVRAVLQVSAQSGTELGIDVFGKIGADLQQYLIANHENL